MPTLEKQKGKPSPRVQALMDLGVIIGHESEWTGEPGVDRTCWELLDSVRGVNLSSFITPAMWVEIAQREGSAYVGGCCGNMSRVQDEINAVFRDGGWADGRNLLLIGESMREHDGTDSAFREMDDEDFGKMIESWRKAREKDPDALLDPWKLIGVVYAAVEPFLTPSSIDVPKAVRWTGEEDHLVGTVHNTLYRMDMADLFARDEEDEQAQHQANQALLKARLLPAMRRLTELIEAAGVGLDGFALINPENGEVFSDHRGLCLYQTREQAERTRDQWTRWAKEEAKRREDRLRRDPDADVSDDYFWDGRKSEIVEATVTVEDGLKVKR